MVVCINLRRGGSYIEPGTCVSKLEIVPSMLHTREAKLLVRILPHFTLTDSDALFIFIEWL